MTDAEYLKRYGETPQQTIARWEQLAKDDIHEFCDRDGNHYWRKPDDVSASCWQWEHNHRDCKTCAYQGYGSRDSILNPTLPKGNVLAQAQQKQ